MLTFIYFLWCFQFLLIIREINYHISSLVMSQSQPLEYFLQGQKENKKTLIVFLQGWPDNHTVWDHLDWKNNEISKNSLLFMNFPNTSSTQETISWGQDFPVVIERMRATFEAVKARQFDKVMLVAHDWGCTYGYLYDQTYPGFFSDMITLDVPGMVQISGVKPKIFVMIYQLLLMFSFLIGGFAGKFMTQTVAKFFKYNPPHMNEISGSRNYPYYYFMKNIFKSLLNKEKRYLKGYTPSTSVAYLYAKKKPFSFHGAKWLNYLQNTKNCQVHPIDSGHWIMIKYGKFVTDLIKRRVLMK